MRLALSLVRALARSTEGGPLDWGHLPVTDLDVALLRIRQMMLGDLIRTGARCAAAGCSAPIDLSFRIGEFLEHQQPELMVGTTPAGEPGWFRLDDHDIAFRLPSCGDLLAIATHPDGAGELLRRCIRPADAPAPACERAQAVMEALAPSLYAELHGVCPECGAAIAVPFDPMRYVLQELRARAAFIYEEVHCLAGRYHWPEHEILA